MRFLTPFLAVPSAAEAAGLNRYPAASKLYTSLLTLSQLPRWREFNSIAPSNAELALRTGIRAKDRVGLQLLRLRDLGLLTIVHRWGQRRQIFVHGRHVPPSPLGGVGEGHRTLSQSQEQQEPIRIDPSPSLSSREISNTPECLLSARAIHAVPEQVPETREGALPDGGAVHTQTDPEPTRQEAPMTATPESQPKVDPDREKTLKLGELLRGVEAFLRPVWGPKGGEWQARHTAILAQSIREAFASRRCLLQVPVSEIVSELRTVSLKLLDGLASVGSPRVLSAHYQAAAIRLDDAARGKESQRQTAGAVFRQADEGDALKADEGYRLRMKGRVRRLTVHISGGPCTKDCESCQEGPTEVPRV